VDRGLIFENPRGLSAESAESGLRVDFTKVQGPLRKISEIIRIMNYFPTVNPVHRVHARWTGASWTVHRGPTVAQIDGMMARSSELGHRPLRCTEARRQGRKMERGARGPQLGPHQGSSGAEEAGRRWCRTGRPRCSVRGLLRRGERKIGVWRGAVKLGEGARLL
jgi:hypothetical protein